MVTGRSEETSGRIRLGMVGGGNDAFIGGVHRIAARLDDKFELVAGAVSSLLLTEEVILLREWLGGGMIILAAWLAARIHAEGET